MATGKKFDPKEFAGLSVDDRVNAIEATKSVGTLNAMWEESLKQSPMYFSFLPLVAVFTSGAFNSSQQLVMIKEITKRMYSVSASTQLLVCDLIAKYFVRVSSTHQEVFKYFVMITLPVCGNAEIMYLTYSAPAMNDKMWVTIMQGTSTQFGEALNFLADHIVGTSNLISKMAAFRNLVIAIKGLPWETNSSGAHVFDRLDSPDLIASLSTSQCLTLLKVTDWFNADYISEFRQHDLLEAVLNRANSSILNSNLR